MAAPDSARLASDHEARVRRSRREGYVYVALTFVLLCGLLFF